MEGVTEPQIAHCSACGCEMDITALGPYTNVVCPDCGHHTRVKCELDHYLLTNRYAAGGMSMVFAAEDTTLQREVALKVLNETYSGDEVRMEQFRHEAQITAALSHPHIVRVFTVGKAYGVYYIAMEMVSGGNLEQRMTSDGAIKEDEILPMTSEIIAGLRAAKDAGVIHRDVKPGNILFDGNGRVKIVDFGLALITHGGTAKAEEIWATPYYVPPEALDGLEEDFRSDIYALGATLYHALSGKPPIAEDTKSTREVRKAKESILPLAKVAPWLKPETCYLVDKAMALRPEQRFSSYQEMEEAWESAYHATEDDGAAEPIHSRERARRRKAPVKGGIGLIITGAIALVLATAAILIFLKNDDADVDGEQPTEDVAQEVITDAPDLTESGNYSPDVALQIGQMFRDSHALLKERKYDEAKEVFEKLRNHEQVKEPAGSWAGVEAVVATWLGGNSGDATTAIGELKEHMERRKISASSEMSVLVDQLSQPGVINNPQVSAGSMATVHLIAVAIKNWEIGAWDAAVPVFRKIQSMEIPQSNPLHVYRELSRRYLADYQLLKPFTDQSAPETLGEAQARSEQLKEALKKIQTRGRARFHIRVWQIRTLYQIRELREKEVQAGIEASKAPAYATVLPKYHQLVAAARYAEAAELLQDVSIKDADKKEREALVYLADSASAFLGSLEDVIPDSGVSMKILGVNNKVYSKILSAKSGGLNLQLENTEVFLAWGKILPDSVLNIHQKAFKHTLKNQEGQLRTEQAVCYAWLSGQYEKADRAANVLSDANKNFRKRWKRTVDSVKRKP